MNNFVVGTRVGFNFDKFGKGWDMKSCMIFGTITEIIPDGRVIVKWDWVKGFEYYNEYFNRPIEVSDLMTEEDKTSKHNQMKAAFEMVDNEVCSNLKKATEYLTRANEIAKANGHRNIQDFNKDTRYTFVDALELAGWDMPER